MRPLTIIGLELDKLRVERRVEEAEKCGRREQSAVKKHIDVRVEPSNREERRHREHEKMRAVNGGHRGEKTSKRRIGFSATTKNAVNFCELGGVCTSYLCKQTTKSRKTQTSSAMNDVTIGEM